MTTPNTELAYRALDAATAYPDHFKMDMWVRHPKDAPVGLDELTGTDCGTTACLAGWAAALNGYQIDYRGHVYRNGQPIYRDIETLAEELLGISEDTSAWLFYVGDDEIADAVAKVFGPRPEPAP